MSTRANPNRGSVTIATNQNPTPMPFTIAIKPWAKKVLNCNESAFQKLYQTEIKWGKRQEDGKIKPLFDLEKDQWHDVMKEYIEMNIRCSFEVIANYKINNEDKNMFSHFYQIDDNSVETRHNEICNPLRATETDQENIKQNDARLKSHILYEKLTNSLTERDKDTMSREENKWTMTVLEERYCDGLTFFYEVEKKVKPQTMNMIENLKNKIRSMDMKGYNSDVKLCLTDYQLRMKEIGQLGGNYDESEKIVDFWRLMKTNLHPSLRDYVRRKKEAFDDTPFGTAKTSVKDLIQVFKDKQTTMESEQEKWKTMPQILTTL